MHEELTATCCTFINKFTFWILINVPDLINLVIRFDTFGETNEIWIGIEVEGLKEFKKVEEFFYWTHSWGRNFAPKRTLDEEFVTERTFELNSELILNTKPITP